PRLRETAVLPAAAAKTSSSKAPPQSSADARSTAAGAPQIPSVSESYLHFIRSRLFPHPLAPRLLRCSSGSRCLTASPPSHKITSQMKKSRGHFNIVLRPEPEGGFTVIVPALPGCVTYGRTLAEAKKMAKDAISGYVASLRKHNEPVPTAS